MGWSLGINCRATSGFVTDGAGETYSLANTDSAYPVSRASNTFGYTSVYGDAERDRNSGVNAHFAGIHQRPNNTAGQSVFRVDLPVPGLYTFRCAFGDNGNDQIQYFEVFDNTTSLFSVSNISSLTDNYVDATGTSYSRANWPGSNTAVTGLAFTSGIFIIKYGKGGSGTLASTMAHIFLMQEPPKQLGALGAG